MAKLHLYPVFHVIVDVGRLSEPPDDPRWQQLVAEHEQELAGQLQHVEFSFGETEPEYTAEFSGAFDPVRTHLVASRRVLRAPLAWEQIAEYVERLDYLIDGEEDELAQTLAPIRDFLTQLNIEKNKQVRC